MRAAWPKHRLRTAEQAPHPRQHNEWLACAHAKVCTITGEQCSTAPTRLQRAPDPCAKGTQENLTSDLHMFIVPPNLDPPCDITLPCDPSFPCGTSSSSICSSLLIPYNGISTTGHALIILTHRRDSSKITPSSRGRRSAKLGRASGSLSLCTIML
jgi:hypothetical protein